MMKPSRDQDGLAFEILATVVARSQIAVARPAKPAPHFPAGFDEVDICHTRLDCRRGATRQAARLPA